MTIPINIMSGQVVWDSFRSFFWYSGKDGCNFGAWTCNLPFLQIVRPHMDLDRIPAAIA